MNLEARNLSGSRKEAWRQFALSQNELAQLDSDYYASVNLCHRQHFVRPSSFPEEQKTSRIKEIELDIILPWERRSQ